MGKYVEQNLLPNEKIITLGHVHWFSYVPSVALSLLGFNFIISTGVFGWLMLIVGLVLIAKVWVHSTSTELAVTNKRVIAKFGFIQRSSIELLHSKVESFHVEQGIFGRIFNFGTVIINGTGGAKTPIPRIAAPLDFRRQALGAIEENQR
jgi:uncharacterized membrane protein YdbT with pleckstrin-like domain